MFLTGEQMKSLKQANVSKDKRKTQERFKTDFTLTSPAQKRALEEISGQNKNSIYRVTRTGSPNARIVLAMAQVKDITPFYYTGETDEAEPCTDALIVRFLETHGYDDLAAELNRGLNEKPKRSYNRKKPKNVVSVMDNAETETDDTATIITEPVDTPSTIEDSAEHESQIVSEDLPEESETDIDINAISEDDAVFLLKAMYIRSKAGQSKRLIALKRF
jgi:hypothetical protein